MKPGVDWRRRAPTLLAGLLAVIYVILSPPTRDLAAHLLRAKLFRTEGFGLWSNWWYAGHHVPGYSVLLPPLAAALTPQLAAALAATGSAALFEALARAQFGPAAWLGALWFAAGTATNLFTGRLTFAFGLLPALGAALALQRGRPWLASGLGVLTALCSPIAALFAALAGAAHALGALAGRQPHAGWRILAGLGLALGALTPVAVLAVVFPEGGSEPFAFATLWPIPLIGVIAIQALPRRNWTLRAGVALYAVGCVAAFSLRSPVGSNAARLGALVAGPLAALLWWRARRVLLLAAAPALLYLQWQAPIRDLRDSSDDPSVSAAYYQPLLAFLAHRPGPPFRVEIPFTQSHWETYRVAPRFPLARGWERQLDIEDNRLFYDGRLTPAIYDAWLHRFAVRFVAVSDAALDYSARRENALIAGRPAYLRLVAHPRHWRIYAVAGATPIVQGAATLRALGPNSLTLDVKRPGVALVRVRFTPYWALAGSPGCVEPWGALTQLTLRRAGRVRLVIRFAAGRIGARSPRCG